MRAHARTRTVHMQMELKSKECCLHFIIVKAIHISQRYSHAHVRVCVVACGCVCFWLCVGVCASQRICRADEVDQSIKWLTTFEQKNQVCLHNSNMNFSMNYILRKSVRQTYGLCECVLLYWGFFFWKSECAHFLSLWFNISVSIVYHTYINTWAHACIHARISLDTYMHKYMHAYVCAYIQTHTNIHTYTYIHTYMDMHTKLQRLLDNWMHRNTSRNKGTWIGLSMNSSRFILICVYIFTRLYVYTHIQIYVYIHEYVWICTWKYVCVCVCV